METYYLIDNLGLMAGFSGFFCFVYNLATVGLLGSSEEDIMHQKGWQQLFENRSLEKGRVSIRRGQRIRKEEFELKARKLLSLRFR